MAPVARSASATARRVSSRRAASREENGSSSSTSDGSGARARASATRCCWPPESWCGERSARSASRPDQGEQLAHPAAVAALAPRQAEADVGRPPTGAGTARPPAARSRCRGGGPATLRPAPATTRSPRVTVPASGSSKPAISRSSVVLPQPDGPSSAVRLPPGTCRSTPVRTGVAVKDLVRSFTVSELMWSDLVGRRRDSSTVAGAESSTMTTAYGAAAPYSRALLADQNAVASVVVPVGASSSVAVSSVTTARKTRAGARADARGEQRQGDPAQPVGRRGAERRGDVVVHRRATARPRRRTVTIARGRNRIA